MTRIQASPRVRRAAPFAIAAAYVATWVVGLAVGAPEVAPTDDGAAIVASYAASPAALAQAVLVHGLAAVLLLALAAVLATIGAPGARVRRATTVVAGAVAAALALVQLGGEIALATGVDAEAARTLWRMVAIVDGAKMLALAALVVASPARVGGGALAADVLVALALVASGVGYLLLQPTLMAAAVASLPALLAWSLWTAVSAGRRTASRQSAIIGT